MPVTAHPEPLTLIREIRAGPGRGRLVAKLYRAGSRQVVEVKTSASRFPDSDGLVRFDAATGAVLDAETDEDLAPGDPSP